MSVLDDLTVNIEDVVATQTALTPPTAERMSPAVRLQKLFAITPVNAVPAQINHARCSHPETDTARRRCRREKIAAAGIAAQENKITIEQDGERWISTAAIRAEILRLAQQYRIGARNLNEILVRLGQEPTLYIDQTAQMNDIRVIFDVSVSERPTDYSLAHYVERFNRLYGGLKVKQEGTPQKKTRTYSTYENEVLVSSEERTEEICQLLMTGTFTFNRRIAELSVEQRVDRVQDLLRRNLSRTIDSIRTVEHNLNRDAPGQEDYDLVEQWKQLNNLSTRV